MRGMLYPPDKQARSVVDKGSMTEVKPIALSGEGSAVTRVGPLFYWSWFQSPLDGQIKLQQRQGFEIITYIIKGKINHKNSLGTQSVLEAGELQMMRTGSGMKFEERWVGPDAEGFQIWFEPHLRDAMKMNPSYRQYRHADIPVENTEGVITKNLIGRKSRAEVTPDADMYDIQLQAGKEMKYRLRPGRFLAALAVRGGGLWTGTLKEEALTFTAGDFMQLSTEAEEEVTLHAAAEVLRMILIDVPENPGYPLYRKKP